MLVELAKQLIPLSVLSLSSPSDFPSLLPCVEAEVCKGLLKLSQ